MSNLIDYKLEKRKKKNPPTSEPLGSLQSNVNVSAAVWVFHYVELNEYSNAKCNKVSLIHNCSCVLRVHVVPQ